MQTEPLQVIEVYLKIKFYSPQKKFYRLARSLMIDKPVLLEGAPGSGKSSLIVALAALTGHTLTRLNLSDQTVIL